MGPWFSISINSDYMGLVTFLTFQMHYLYLWVFPESFHPKPGKGNIHLFYLLMVHEIFN